MPPQLRKSPTAPKRQTLKELQELQRLAASVIMQPLAPGFKSSKTRPDGNSTTTVVESFIKPNDRLTAFERIEIYNKQYWFRLIDCLYDDYPGLLVVLGKPKFNKLITSYIEQYPSRSFTLRDLGDRLEQWIIDKPELTGSKQQLAREMTAFEWAQVVAFDGPGLPPLGLDDLLSTDPNRLTLQIQPYISLLEMHWPLDDFALAMKRQQQALRSEASNAVDAPSEKAAKDVPLPKKSHVFVAVHRLNDDLYYKRLEPLAYQLLIALRAGKTLADACGSEIVDGDPNGGDPNGGDPNGGDPAAWAGKIQQWFSEWMQMGWFCKR